MSTRASKQWSLTKHESITFHNILSLDTNFACFLADNVTWLKKSPATPLRGLEDDGESVQASAHRTAQQKCTHLDLMLGQITNYCP